MKITINSSAPDRITLTFTGHLEIDSHELQNVVGRFMPHNLSEAENHPQRTEAKQPYRLAYTVQETAELIGVSPITVYRLIYRGLLRANKYLRRKIISKKELERFLEENG